MHLTPKTSLFMTTSVDPRGNVIGVTFDFKLFCYIAGAGIWYPLESADTINC